MSPEKNCNPGPAEDLQTIDFEIERLERRLSRYEHIINPNVDDNMLTGPERTDLYGERLEYLRARRGEILQSESD